MWAPKINKRSDETLRMTLALINNVPKNAGVLENSQFHTVADLNIAFLKKLSWLVKYVKKKKNQLLTFLLIDHNWSFQSFL